MGNQGPFFGELNGSVYISGRVIQDVYEIQSGDHLFIMNRPSRWASRLNRECPFDYNIKYPHLIEVKSIIHDERTQEHTPISCGNYGWDLPSIIKRGGRIAYKINFKKIK